MIVYVYIYLNYFDDCCNINNKKLEGKKEIEFKRENKSLISAAGFQF